MVGPTPPKPERSTAPSTAPKPARSNLPSAKTWRSLVLVVAIAAVVGYGLSVRLQDPLSTPVVPAEDPYTHMALVREHLRDGTLDPLNPDGNLYPPGMHALLAAIVAYTGSDIYDLVRVGPALFGALGLAGAAILLARYESLGAALAGSLAFAIMPETIFRTTMMSPTAVDLALLPFFAFAILMTLQGKLAWAGAATAIGGFLLFSHPWLFGILGVAGLALVLLITILPWPAARYGPLIAPWGLVAVVAIVGSGVALSLTGCWGGCGPGFRDVMGDDAAPVLANLSVAVLLLSLLPLAIKALRPRAFNGLLPAQRAATPFGARLLISQALLVAVVAIGWAAVNDGLPPLVDLVRMFGWPLLIVGGLGLVFLPFRPTPGGHVGAALALATFPFVVFNPFNSPFWSHRTAVYFGVGLAILAGVFAAALIQGALALARRLPTGPSAAPDAPGMAPAPHRVAPLVAVSGMFLLICLAGGVIAATPAQYEGGWYRLYSECEFAGLQDVGRTADSNPELLVITPTWQSKLVLSGISSDAQRFWYKPDFYSDANERANVIQMLEQQGRPILVLVDSKMAMPDGHPEIDASFLDAQPWSQYSTWCTGDLPQGGAPAAGLRAYTLE
ncbi:MAG: hypothetical protein QOJ26_192 [Thermoplasmata archaeon]|jgi:hypothetical protein|nr:hypothetical protein [Thermoplasmata archaeon]MEA3165348.1 hypothetical protein [Thermoplasmata archaeon]